MIDCIVKYFDYDIQVLSKFKKKKEMTCEKCPIKKCERKSKIK